MNLKSGDICIYSFDNGNKSLALVQIIKILNYEKGVAEIKFIKVFVDDTGNGMFKYLYEKGKSMNASLNYLKKVHKTWEEIKNEKRNEKL